MDVTRMARKYNAKYTGQYVSDVITALKSDMVASFTQMTELLWAMENQVKGILTGEAVVTVDYPGYYSFAREVFSKQQRFGGGTGLVEEVALLVVKWKGRGCTEAILDKIRNEVFAIPAPAAP